MTETRQYITSIIAASVLCGVVSSFVKSDAQRQSIRLLCGICLIITVISPLRGVETIDFASIYREIRDNMKEYTEAGSELSRDEYRIAVKDQAERYVEEIGNSRNILLDAEIYLDEETFLPVRITVYGMLSEEDKAEIGGKIQSELGIRLEDQMWIS